jgi:hypothetical protein
MVEYKIQGPMPKPRYTVSEYRALSNKHSNRTFLEDFDKRRNEVNKARSLVKSQEDLDKLIESSGAAPGKLYIFKNIVTRPLDIFYVAYCVAVENNFNDIIFDFRGNPKILYLSNILINNGYRQPYRRSDTVVDFVEISEETLKQIVGDKYDLVQNHLKQEQELFHSSKSIWCTLP